MNLITYLADSRGIVNSMQRLPTIASRFGISSRKMERALSRYVELAAEYGTSPTFAVTANLVERYPGVFRRLDERGVELAIHGYVHTDYSVLDLDEQRRHLKKGLLAFDQLGINVTGFRCPYVRWNDESVTAAKEMGLTYGSNRSVAWDVVPRSNGISERGMIAYRKGLALYRSNDAASAVSLPSFVSGLLDLPASLPDDEAMVDRLHASPDERAGMWRAVLDETYGLGEMFVLILHHERLALCHSALKAVLDHTRGRTPHVWLASMREISEWWHHRASFKLAWERLDEGRYRFAWPSDPRLTVLARGITAKGLSPWSGDWMTVPGTHVTITSSALPAIRVDPGASPAFVSFLEQEGYVVQRGGQACALHLEGWTEFADHDKRRVIEIIEQADAPLIRIWRWPSEARSVLSLTGDVDSMTLIDFLRRPLEV